MRIIKKPFFLHTTKKGVFKGDIVSTILFKIVKTQIADDILDMEREQDR